MDRSLVQSEPEKSEIIKRLKTKFEAKGFKDPPSEKYPEGKSRVILCGFTHVAAANLGEDGITVLRTLHRDARRKRSVLSLTKHP